MSLRLDLIVRTYKEGDRWTWRLWSGSRIVSSSGSQRFSRRIDAAEGAEVGAGLSGVADAIRGREFGDHDPALRHTAAGWIDSVAVRVRDERRTKP